MLPPWLLPIHLETHCLFELGLNLTLIILLLVVPSPLSIFATYVVHLLKKTLQYRQGL